MNSEILKESLQNIDGEMMQSPITNEELENLRKALLFRVHFIEQMQIQKVA